MIEEIREVSHNKKSYSNQVLRPTIITWKDQKMIRNQSIRACVREILNYIQNLDVVHVNIVGNPSTGKTELAKLLGHLIHILSSEGSGIPFSVKLFDKVALLNFEATLKKLTPTNWVLIFDDLSFLGASATKKQMEIIKQAMTEIRHLEGGQDVKIIIIKVSHYTLGLDKYVRQSDFSFFTSVGSSETENMERIVGSKNMDKVRTFKKVYISAVSHIPGKFTYQLGDKGSFTYRYKDPFIPSLFWNGDTLRHVVSPSRKWVDKFCETCIRASEAEQIKEIIDVSKFVDESGNTYGESIFKAAVKNRLLKVGINVYHPSVVSAERYLDKCLETGNVTLDQIANHYGFKPTNTKMRKKLTGEILNPSKDQKPGIVENDNNKPLESIIDGV